ncbi:hypothetical protein ABZT47_12795 [Sphaerisporangium sp. NPDC005289]|uniref:hypothetical protein n=1 Tax=Sphaerisporangium sp. NPDC005289 TaxID=3155247 RepID=UPI0033BA755A
MRDYRARLGYLDQVTTLLYPTPAPTPSQPSATDPGTAVSVPPETGRSSPASHSTPSTTDSGVDPGSSGARAAYAVLPSRYLPRRLVPRSRWLPGRRRLPHGPGTIETYLSEVFGRPVKVIVHVRPARRANRKPILEIRSGSGEPLAFVKIGDTERSRSLVRHESAVLEALAGLPLRVVAAPIVLHHGVWNGLDVLALSPLATRRRRVPAALLEDAVHEIAALAVPRATPGEGRASPFVPSQRPSEDDLTDPARPLATGHPRPSASTDQVRSLAADPGRHLATGHPARSSAAGDEVNDGAARVLRLPADGRGDHAWHGDFSPWNMALSPDGRLAVWDWERFTTGVPLGFDALHHFFQRALRRMPPRLAAEACVAGAVRTLAPYGPSAGAARWTAVQYLITLADRHEGDGHQPLGPPAAWLNPALDHLEVLH